MAYHHFRTEQMGEVLVARLVDARLTDNMTISEFQDELLLLLDRESAKKLLVNFQKVSQCSTAVINALLRAKKKLLARKGQIKLCCLHPVIREAYQILNLDGTVFHIHDSEPEALTAFNYV